jgi:hypothetical protein
VAARVDALPEAVLRSFKSDNPTERQQQLKRATTEIFIDAHPILQWIERNQGASANRVTGRLAHLLSEAVRCAGLVSPELAGGQRKPLSPDSPVTHRLGTLKVEAMLCANMLHGWAGDIEAREAPTPTVGDHSAFRPASAFVDDDRFPTLKAIHKALGANKWIRRKRPLTSKGKEHPQRLLIHAGDWQDFKNRPRDPLDNPAEVVDAIAEAVARKEEIDKAKGRQ